MAALGLRDVPIPGGPAAYTARARRLRPADELHDHPGDAAQPATRSTKRAISISCSPRRWRRARVLLAKLCGIAAQHRHAPSPCWCCRSRCRSPCSAIPGCSAFPLLLVALALVSACLGLAITLWRGRSSPARAPRGPSARSSAPCSPARSSWSRRSSRNGRGRPALGGDEPVRLAARAPISAATGSARCPAAPRSAIRGAAALLLGGGDRWSSPRPSCLFGRAFLASYQQARMRLSRRRGRATGAVARHFRAGLFATMFAKEWRLLRPRSGARLPDRAAADLSGADRARRLRPWHGARRCCRRWPSPAC